MRRRVHGQIVYRGQCIDAALAHCRIDRDKTTETAMLISAVEALESTGYTEAEIRELLDQIFDAPVAVDPRADTRGT